MAKQVLTCSQVQRPTGLRRFAESRGAYVSDVAIREVGHLPRYPPAIPEEKRVTRCVVRHPAGRGSNAALILSRKRVSDLWERVSDKESNPAQRRQ